MTTAPPRVPDGMAEVLATYGDPRPHVLPTGEWVVDPAWERTNMVRVEHPDFPRGRFYMHRAAAEPLLLLLSDWKSIGGYSVKTLGCFAPRAQRGSLGLVMSLHTLGIAFDLNADHNKLIASCPLGDPRRLAPGSTDIPPAWVDAARRRGWFWGGDFKGRFDPMHFQLATGC